MSGSIIHSKFIQLQKEVLKANKPIELKRLCLTRWSSQIYCCRSVRDTLEIILLLLNKFNAERLLKRINFKFIYLLLVFNEFLSQIHIVSKYLQDTNVDIIESMALIEATKQYFLDLRNDNSQKKIYDESIKLSINLNIKHPSMIGKQKRIKKIPKHFEKFFLEKNVVQKPPLTSEKQFKTGLFYCILDNIIHELNKDL